jgi:hypothetical protein
MDDPSRLIDCMSNNQDKKQLSLRKIPRTSAPKLEHTIKGVYKNKAATPLRTKTITMAQVAKNGERRAGTVPEATPRKVLYRSVLASDDTQGPTRNYRRKMHIV